MAGTPLVEHHAAIRISHATEGTVLESGGVPPVGLRSGGRTGESRTNRSGRLVAAALLQLTTGLTAGRVRS